MTIENSLKELGPDLYNVYLEEIEKIRSYVVSHTECEKTKWVAMNGEYFEKENFSCFWIKRKGKLHVLPVE